MTKFLILFAIVAFASVNAQFNHGNAFAAAGAGAGAVAGGLPGFPGFPVLPFAPLPLFPQFTPEAISRMKPISGSHYSGGFVSSMTHNGKTETVFGTNNDGKGEMYHIKS